MAHSLSRPGRTWFPVAATLAVVSACGPVTRDAEPGARASETAVSHPADARGDSGELTAGAGLTGQRVGAPAVESADPRRAILDAMVDVRDLGDYEIVLAYDLGIMRTVTLSRPGGAPPISLTDMTVRGAEITDDQLDRGFGGESFGDGRHPLEPLGYDLVRPKAHGELEDGALRLPWLEFSWARSDETIGELETGDGGALWLRCPSAARWLFLTSDAPKGRFDRKQLRSFADRLRWCGNGVKPHPDAGGTAAQSVDQGPE